MILPRQLIRLTWGRSDQLALAKAALVFLIGDFSDRNLQVAHNLHHHHHHDHLQKHHHHDHLKNTILVWISLSLIFISQIQEEINEEAKQFGDILQVEFD